MMSIIKREVEVPVRTVEYTRQGDAAQVLTLKESPTPQTADPGNGDA